MNQRGGGTIHIWRTGAIAVLCILSTAKALAASTEVRLADGRLTSVDPSQVGNVIRDGGYIVSREELSWESTRRSERAEFQTFDERLNAFAGGLALGLTAGLSGLASPPINEDVEAYGRVKHSSSYRIAGIALGASMLAFALLAVSNAKSLLGSRKGLWKVGASAIAATTGLIAGMGAHHRYSEFIRREHATMLAERHGHAREAAQRFYCYSAVKSGVAPYSICFQGADCWTKRDSHLRDEAGYDVSDCESVARVFVARFVCPGAGGGCYVAGPTPEVCTALREAVVGRVNNLSACAPEEQLGIDR